MSHALGPLALRIEHIGSTSIPGMAAKPVFDLQVSVVDLVISMAEPWAATTGWSPAVAA